MFYFFFFPENNLCALRSQTMEWKMITHTQWFQTDGSAYTTRLWVVRSVSGGRWILSFSTGARTHLRTPVCGARLPTGVATGYRRFAARLSPASAPRACGCTPRLNSARERGARRSSRTHVDAHTALYNVITTSCNRRKRREHRGSWRWAGTVDNWYEVRLTTAALHLVFFFFKRECKTLFFHFYDAVDLDHATRNFNASSATATAAAHQPVSNRY